MTYQVTTMTLDGNNPEPFYRHAKKNTFEMKAAAAYAAAIIRNSYNEDKNIFDTNITVWFSFANVIEFRRYTASVDCYDDSPEIVYIATAMKNAVKECYENRDPKKKLFPRIPRFDTVSEAMNYCDAEYKRIDDNSRYRRVYKAPGGGYIGVSELKPYIGNMGFQLIASKKRWVMEAEWNVRNAKN